MGIQMQTSSHIRASTFHITFLGLLLALATAAMGQEATLESRVESWLEERLKEAERPQNLDGIALTWHVAHPPSGTAEDLAQLRSLVAGKPIHPLRAQIERLEHELQYGPASETFTLWYERDNRWRLNREVAHQPSVPYVDVACKGDLAWSLTSVHVNVVDSDSAPSGYEYANQQQDFKLHINSFLLNNLDVCSRFGARVEEVVSRDQANWSAVLQTADGTREYLVSGHWSETAGQPFIDSLDMIYTGESETSKRSIDYADWRYDDVLARWTPHEVVHLKGDGTPWFALSVVESVAYDSNELDALLEPPTPAGSDPIRGAYTFRSLNDFRPGVESGFVLTEGEMTERPLPVSPRGGAMALRRIGWWALALLVAAFVGIRLWQKR